MTGGNKISFTFKQICSFYDLLYSLSMKVLKENAYKNAFL